MSDTAPILELSGISKEFHGNRVLTDVDLDLLAGEIHALVGENGAGKSTLMNILFGMPVIRETGGYTGRIRLAGEEVDFAGPYEAMANGIGMVHQEFMLLPGLSVAENVMLNREPVIRVTGGKLDLLDMKRLGSKARRSLDRAGLDIDEWMPVAGLPVGHMQFVEIAREIGKEDSRVVVFDEPTAVLTEDDAGRLLEIMRSIAGEGIGVLFITHRLDEVTEVADRVTVLRDGRVIECLPGSEADPLHVAELMVGRPVEKRATRHRRRPAEEYTLLELSGFEVDMPGEKVRGVDLEVERGEILGIGGLAGHGKVGVANGIMGLYPTRGDLTFGGRPLPPGDPGEALRRGIAFVSEDRRGVGLLLDSTLERNVAATALASGGRFLAGPAWLGPLRPVSRRHVRYFAEEMIGALDIRCQGSCQTVRRLSGGNQQKVCLARAMALNPRLLLVSEPTRGIDVGAKELILDRLIELREEGVTIVMTSSELAELRAVCDRIAIIYRGRVEAVLPPDDTDARFGLAMAGELDLLERRR